MKLKEKYYGTFGQKLAIRDNYVVIRASSEAEAHSIMEHHFCQDWSMIYEARSFQRRYFPGGAITLSQAKAAVGQYYKAAYQEVT